MLPVVEKNTNTISTYEFHSLIVNWVLVVTTLLTVIVALLKEEIVKCFRHPKLSIHRKEKNALKENTTL